MKGSFILCPLLTSPSGASSSSWVVWREGRGRRGLICGMGFKLQGFALRLHNKCTLTLDPDRAELYLRCPPPSRRYCIPLATVSTTPFRSLVSDHHLFVSLLLISIEYYSVCTGLQGLSYIRSSAKRGSQPSTCAVSFHGLVGPSRPSGRLVASKSRNKSECSVCLA